MTDYKELRLKASSSPHIRTKENAGAIMLDVIIALLPALAFAVYNFGLRALTVTLVSVVGCVLFEVLYRLVTRQHQTVGDCSAIVTGMLIAFVCPVTIPYWMLLIGDFFAIVIVKQLYGGLGKNFLNPALAARAFLFSWADAMSTWAAPGTRAAVWGAVDVVTSPTPMSYLHAGELQQLRGTYQYVDLFLGKIGGSVGEVSALCLLLGFGWLLLRRVILPIIPVSFVGTVALLTFFFPQGHDSVSWMLCHILSGGLLLGAIFMATDYVTSPVTRRGQLIYGVGCGAITVFIRYFGAFSEGVTYAILCMNLVVWLIDKHMRPRRFGVTKTAGIRNLLSRLTKKEGDEA